MKKFINKIEKFMKSEDGPTAVEYAIMLALIVIVCLTAIQAVGTAAKHSVPKHWFTDQRFAVELVWGLPSGRLC